ncbi:MAG: PD-(D/E)XK nuclease family protein [Defluviitaleaceae bacterium]|nr:PD-(D/E)XK nuclease family protein [Defluviitaleaceae bacterium]
MPLQFILGSPGTGKTTYCLQGIEAAIDSNAPLYYLVPEQFSLQSEKLILAKRTASTRVQVLSFNRLAYRFFAYMGGPSGQVADDLGKTMLLRKVLLELAPELIFYKRQVERHGFVDALATTITELNHYCISSEDLALRSHSMGPSLGAKLQDLALILSRYRSAVKDRYILADDMLSLLIQKLNENNDIPILKNAQIWVDGFTGFTPQERNVLLCLLKHGADIKITLTTRTTPRKAPDPLFTTPRRTEESITALAKSAHIPILPPIYLDTNYRHINNPSLAFFAENFTMIPKKIKPFPDRTSIEILSSADRYGAIFTAAQRIITMVNEGYRYRDIAIVCGDKGHYEKTLHTTFDRLGIPLFVDSEIDILSHPLTEFIRAALSILAHNWTYEGVFRLLKTRLTGMASDDIDIIENYALAHGITGYKWQYPFKGIAEAGRLHILKCLEDFGTGQKKDTVRGFSQKIFDTQYRLNVPHQLQQWYDHHMKISDPETAQIHKQIWPKICQVFDKLVEILGDEVVNIDSFASILDAGLAQVSLGRIPPTVDQVVLGDTGRSRYPQIKAMIVLGANEGNLPPMAPSPGLFSEDERAQLINTAVELAPDNLQRIKEQYYSLYCVLSQPSERLCFIYPEGDPKGKILRPSHVLKRIQGLYQQLEVEKAPILNEYIPAHNIQDNKIDILTTAQSIYGSTIITAASRLEAFARCPFQYFMNYLLEARPRQRYEVLPTDLGNLYHDILAQFTKGVASGEIDITNIDRSAINAIVGNLITASTPNMGIFQTSGRNKHMLTKVEDICSTSIWAMCQHLKRGSFMPLGAELDFGKNSIPMENTNLILTGRIDRIDILPTENNQQYIRVIDYKSGQARFDMKDVHQGLQLQLMLYMNAIIKSPEITGGKITHPAGVFYFPIDNPIIDTDNDIGEAALDEALLKNFRMSGVTLDGEKVLQGMDKRIAPGMDSSVIPVRLNKDGSISKTIKETVLSTDDFFALGQVAEDKAKELSQRMIDGDITPQPCPKGPKNPCQYCAYGAICGGSLI